MLLKSRDPKPNDSDDKRRKAGADAEHDAARLINFHYGTDPDWAVIHDLRIEANGRSAQIDHLLINRSLDFYVLESKSFSNGLSVNERGEFVQWWDGKPKGIESPIHQNGRHVKVLRDAVEPLLPSVMGVRLAPRMRSFVLLSTKTTFKRPETFPTDEIIKVDALDSQIENDAGGEGILVSAANALRRVSTATLRRLGDDLIELHTSKSHKCGHCRSGKLRIEYLKGPGYHFQCDDCSGTTAIPKPDGSRVSRTGDEFFFVGANGRMPFFSNPPSAAPKKRA